jgi:probable rRNA maturation factor
VVTIESKLEGISEPALGRFVLRARRAAGLRGQVHVLVVSSRRMRTLNWQFRGQDKPTDVLSFPAMPEVTHDFAGDIVISGDIAATNARRFEHPLAQELKVLILHGVLHLGGHDHETDDGAMARKELRLRKQLGLTDGLIERTERVVTRNSKLGTQHSRGCPTLTGVGRVGKGAKRSTRNSKLRTRNSRGCPTLTGVGRVGKGAKRSTRNSKLRTRNSPR